MIQAAKLVIIDNNDYYLMMYRDGHPIFGDDPDIPGGTIEQGETPLDTMIREVYEEAKVVIGTTEAQLVYEDTGTDYSMREAWYSLYAVKLDHRPTIVTSWEHRSYEWLNREDFLEKAKNAHDGYMHMVYDALR